jgi:hypothetical protein
MPGAALINSEPEYPKAGQRKPPTADTNSRSHGSGAVRPLPNLCPDTIPNTIAFPALPAAPERPLNVSEGRALGGLETLQIFIGRLPVGCGARF